MSYLDGRRSSFPDKLDNILELFNMPPSQKPNLRRFQELKSKESLTPTEQLEFNQLTIILQPYMPDVETWNLFGDILINMQKFFKEGVEPYIEEKKIEFQAEVDKLTSRGEWKPDVWYYNKNIVTLGGEGFIAKKDNINQPPPSSLYWAKIAERGRQGEPSLNVNFRGEYDSAMAYSLGDAVTFGGFWYYAKKNTKGNPPTSGEFWEIAPGQIIVGDTEPFDNKIAIWINTNL